MNKVKIIVTSIVLAFFTLTPVHAVSLDKVPERIKILSRSIDSSACFRCWGFPRNGDLHQEFKLNAITSVPRTKKVLNIEAEIDLRAFFPSYRDPRGIWDTLKPQLNASYQINEDVLLKIGLKKKFYKRIKINEKNPSCWPNGAVLEIKNTDVFFLPIDIDTEHQVNYIAGVYSEKFYSFDKYQLDLFGLTTRRTDITGYTAPHCITGGVKLEASYRELEYAKELHQALRLSYQYHNKLPRYKYKRNEPSSQWEATLTNCLKYSASVELDVDFYIASRSFRNVLEYKRPWHISMNDQETFYGFNRPHCGIHTMLTKKLSDELTFSVEAALFCQVRTNVKYLDRSERNNLFSRIKTRLEVVTKYKISKNIIFDTVLAMKTENEDQTFLPHWEDFDLGFSLVVKQNKTKGE